MRNIVKYSLVIFLLTGFFCTVYAADTIVDHSALKTRTPSKEQIEHFTKQKAFNYEKEEMITSTWLQRVMNWIDEKLNDLFSNKPSAAFIRYIIIALLVITIVFTLMKVRPQSLFFKNKKKKDAAFEIEELTLLHSDLDELARKEILNGNFCAAIRYLFLRLLKNLEEKEMIRLDIYKTNLDYKYELKDSELKKEFGKLITVYEFVWYGKFTIEKPAFEKVHDDFKNIYHKLNA